MSQDRRPGSLLCPSAQPTMHGAVAVGVVGGTPTEPRVQPLERPLAVTEELLGLAEPVKPTEVFRFAAPCLCSGCVHFTQSRCGLAAKVVRMLPEVTETLPECDIRPRCRWFAQEGAAACVRCPQVVTDDVNRAPAIRFAADPQIAVPVDEPDRGATC
jgi:hypothetical protein